MFCAIIENGPYRSLRCGPFLSKTGRKPARQAGSAQGSEPTNARKEDVVNNLLRLIGNRLIALPIMVFGVTILVFFLMSFSPSIRHTRRWARERRRKPSTRTAKVTG